MGDTRPAAPKSAVLTRSLTVAAAITGVVGLLAWPRIDAERSPMLRQVGVIRLPAVQGRIDHLAFDPERQHLFVAALGNGTVEVVDTAALAHRRSLRGFHEPQGIAFVPDLRAMAIANGGTGTLQLVDVRTFETRWTVHVADDADNVRYDAAAKRLYVAGVGGLFAIEPGAGTTVGRIAIDGHPESFQLETGGTRLFANLPDHTSIIAADRGSMKATATWTPAGCGANYPMALAGPPSRVLVGCRRPARLAMLDARTGTIVATAGIVGDTDDLFVDDARHRVYVIGGDGFVDVIETDGDRLTAVGRTSTRGGARTGLWVPAQRRLYVALPARDGQPAEIRVFQAV